jgi:2'-deoxymugineic-acid 2'-dioxygenase/mugineic-acid 3-dioxygenase
MYSEDRHKPNRIFSGTTYETGGEKYWRDCLRLACPFPVGDGTKDWPHTPQRLRYAYQLANTYIHVYKYMLCRSPSVCV